MLKYEINKTTYYEQQFTEIKICDTHCLQSLTVQPDTIYGRVQIVAHNIIGKSNQSTCCPTWLEEFGKHCFYTLSVTIIVVACVP